MMHKPRAENNGRWAWAIVLAVVLALLILYALSVGPVVRYFPNSRPLYFPLFWLSTRFKLLGGALSWYLFYVWGVPTD